MRYSTLVESLDITPVFPLTLKAEKINTVFGYFLHVKTFINDYKTTPIFPVTLKAEKIKTLFWLFSTCKHLYQ